MPAEIIKCKRLLRIPGLWLIDSDHFICRIQELLQIYGSGISGVRVCAEKHIGFSGANIRCQILKTAQEPDRSKSVSNLLGRGVNVCDAIDSQQPRCPNRAKTNGDQEQQWRRERPNE
jgi:hypothetical protein